MHYDESYTEEIKVTNVTHCDLETKSILKPAKVRAPLQEVDLGNQITVEYGVVRTRRVSFAGVNRIKEFNSEAKSFSVYSTPVYEEKISTSSDSSALSSNASSNINSLIKEHETTLLDETMELTDLSIDRVYSAMEITTVKSPKPQGIFPSSEQVMFTSKDHELLTKHNEEVPKENTSVFDPLNIFSNQKVPKTFPNPTKELVDELMEESMVDFPTENPKIISQDKFQLPTVSKINEIGEVQCSSGGTKTFSHKVSDSDFTKTCSNQFYMLASKNASISCPDQNSLPNLFDNFNSDKLDRTKFGKENISQMEFTEALPSKMIQLSQNQKPNKNVKDCENEFRIKSFEITKSQYAFESKQNNDKKVIGIPNLSQMEFTEALPCRNIPNKFFVENCNTNNPFMPNYNLDTSRMEFTEAVPLQNIADTDCSNAYEHTKYEISMDISSSPQEMEMLREFSIKNFDTNIIKSVCEDKDLSAKRGVKMESKVFLHKTEPVLGKDSLRSKHNDSNFIDDNKKLSGSNLQVDVLRNENSNELCGNFKKVIVHSEHYNLEASQMEFTEALPIKNYSENILSKPQNHNPLLDIRKDTIASTSNFTHHTSQMEFTEALPGKILPKPQIHNPFISMRNDLIVTRDNFAHETSQMQQMKKQNQGSMMHQELLCASLEKVHGNNVNLKKNIPLLPVQLIDIKPDLGPNNKITNDSLNYSQMEFTEALPATNFKYNYSENIESVCSDNIPRVSNRNNPFLFNDHSSLQSSHMELMRNPTANFTKSQEVPLQHEKILNIEQKENIPIEQNSNIDNSCSMDNTGLGGIDNGDRIEEKQKTQENSSQMEFTQALPPKNVQMNIKKNVFNCSDNNVIGTVSNNSFIPEDNFPAQNLHVEITNTLPMIIKPNQDVNKSQDDFCHQAENVLLSVTQKKENELSKPKSDLDNSCSMDVINAEKTINMNQEHAKQNEFISPKTIQKQCIDKSAYDLCLQTENVLLSNIHKKKNDLSEKTFNVNLEGTFIKKRAKSNDFISPNTNMIQGIDKSGDVLCLEAENVLHSVIQDKENDLSEPIGNVDVINVEETYNMNPEVSFNEEDTKPNDFISPKTNIIQDIDKYRDDQDLQSENVLLSANKKKDNDIFETKCNLNDSCSMDVANLEKTSNINQEGSFIKDKTINKSNEFTSLETNQDQFKSNCSLLSQKADSTSQMEFTEALPSKYYHNNDKNLVGLFRGKRKSTVMPFHSNSQMEFTEVLPLKQLLNKQLTKENEFNSPLRKKKFNYVSKINVTANEINQNISTSSIEITSQNNVIPGNNSSFVTDSKDTNLMEKYEIHSINILQNDTKADISTNLLSDVINSKNIVKSDMSQINVATESAIIKSNSTIVEKGSSFNPMSGHDLEEQRDENNLSNLNNNPKMETFSSNIMYLSSQDEKCEATGFVNVSTVEESVISSSINIDKNERSVNKDSKMDNSNNLSFANNNSEPTINYSSKFSAALGQNIWKEKNIHAMDNYNLENKIDSNVSAPQTENIEVLTENNVLESTNIPTLLTNNNSSDNSVNVLISKQEKSTGMNLALDATSPISCPDSVPATVDYLDPSKLSDLSREINENLATQTNNSSLSASNNQPFIEVMQIQKVLPESDKFTPQISDTTNLLTRSNVVEEMAELTLEPLDVSNKESLIHFSTPPVNRNIKKRRTLGPSQLLNESRSIFQTTVSQCLNDIGNVYLPPSREPGTDIWQETRKSPLDINKKNDEWERLVKNDALMKKHSFEFMSPTKWKYKFKWPLELILKIPKCEFKENTKNDNISLIISKSDLLSSFTNKRMNKNLSVILTESWLNSHCRTFKELIITIKFIEDEYSKLEPLIKSLQYFYKQFPFDFYEDRYCFDVTIDVSYGSVKGKNIEVINRVGNTSKSQVQELFDSLLPNMERFYLFWKKLKCIHKL